MKRVTAVAGKAGTQMRSQPIRKAEGFGDRCACRNKTEQGRQKMKNAYVKLLEIASRVTGQAWKFSREIVGGVKRKPVSPAQSRQATGRNDPVRQVLRQTRSGCCAATPKPKESCSAYSRRTPR